MIGGVLRHLFGVEDRQRHPIEGTPAHMFEGQARDQATAAAGSVWLSDGEAQELLLADVELFGEKDGTQ